MGKVRFGLKNAKYALWDSSTSNYKDLKAIKGSVSLSLDAEGDSSDFYADDVVYATFATNSGYSGTFEIAAAEDEMLKDLLGYIDDDGMLLETTDAKQAEFALVFEVSGNEVEQRICLYNCSLSRAGLNANTKQSSTDPDTQSFNFKAIGRDLELKGETRNVVKATIENTATNAAKFKGFMTAVPMPTAAAA